MQRGFYTIMAAQFFSSLADNALFVAAYQLLRYDGAPVVEFKCTRNTPHVYNNFLYGY